MEEILNAIRYHGLKDITKEELRQEIEDLRSEIREFLDESPEIRIVKPENEKTKVMV